MTDRELNEVRARCLPGSLNDQAYRGEWERRERLNDNRAAWIRFCITTVVALLAIVVALFLGRR